MKGEAMTFRFNNKKIKQYLKYQSINLTKEQMMTKVKANCDRWRALFEKQAGQQYINDTMAGQANLATIESQEQILSRNDSARLQALHRDRD